ncbi:MAG: DUF1549 domain-containing protein, partial [Verrucomicrobiota bacterium]
MTTPRFVRHFTLLGLAVSPSLAFANPAPASAAPAAAAPVDFAQVQAVLESKCLECHNPDKVKGKLLMNTAEAMIKGGSSGTSLVPGKPDESELLKRVVLPADHDDIMPPKGGPLAANEVDLLKRWVAEGAHWPQGLTLRAKSPEEIKALAELNAKLPSMTKLEIFPDKFALETKRDFHQVVVMATFADATTRDVTKFSNLRVADAKIASLAGDVLQPVADAGATELMATLGSTTVKAPVSLNGGQKDRVISFNLDVMPVFLRGGCNAGGCHGAARGKDGFRLSLFGMDPVGDYNRLTREMVGRRVNLAIPEESTLVEKAVGAVPHSGNQCYEPESQYNKAILEWISNGAQYDPPTVAKVTGIEVFPKQIVLEGQGNTQQITVRATYSDGSDRDVTKLALFMSNNDPTASINKDGLVTSGDRGAAFTLARFDVYSVTAQVLVIPAKLEYERPKLVENNYIDSLVNENLHKLRILPSGVCTDEEFVRRAYIDVIGIYPKPDEIKTFLADANPKKREALVDSLTQRKEFTEVWVMKWAELLQIRSGIAGNNNQPPFYKNALLYYNWLGDR